MLKGFFYDNKNLEEKIATIIVQFAIKDFPEANFFLASSSSAMGIASALNTTFQQKYVLPMPYFPAIS